LLCVPATIGLLLWCICGVTVNLQLSHLDTSPILQRGLKCVSFFQHVSCCTDSNCSLLYAIFISDILP